MRCDCVLCSFENPKPTTTAVVIREGKVLVAKRNQKPWKGQWDFLGGYMQKEETPEQALKRELKEELGVESQLTLLGAFSGTDSFKEYNYPIINFAYLTELQGEPRLNHENSELAWVPLKELQTIAEDMIVDPGQRGKGLGDMTKQFIRYAIVGVFNTGLDFGMYAGLTRGFAFWREHFLLANALVFIIVVTWSFFWNKRWAFKNREQKHAAQYTKFMLATLGGIGIAEGVLFAGVELFGIHDIVSKVIAAPLVAVWNFSAYRLWAFRAPRVAQNDIV